MNRFLLFFISTSLLSVSALAQPIESEPLPPPPGQQSTTGISPAPVGVPPSTDPGVIPLTTRSGAPVTTQPGPSSAIPNGGDDGMSGAAGGSSAYDLGAPTSAPAVEPSYTSPERSMDEAPSSSAPQSTQPLAPSVPYGGSIGTAPPDKQISPNTKFCTLKIAFDSRCCGPDEKTAKEIKSYLDENKDNLTYIRSDLGREGEFSYCLDVQQHNNRARIYKALKKLIPRNIRKDSQTGDTTLSGPGFETVTTHK